MFREKMDSLNERISLGRILEIHKITWPFVSTLCILRSSCDNPVRITLMSGYFSSYGILWVVKSNTFYDKSFYYNTKYHYNTLVAILTYLSVSVYYLFPLIASNNCSKLELWELYISSMFFSIGGFLHYAGDAQKFYTLKYRPGKLIKEDLFSVIRHPNYLGEFMMWIALVLISGKDRLCSYIPLGWLFMATVLVGIPQKASSLKKYDEYSKWEKETYNLVPFVY